MARENTRKFETRKDISSEKLVQQPIWHYLRIHPRAFLLGVTALLFTNMFDIFTPLAMKVGIDALTEKEPQKLIRAVLIYAGLMTGVTVFRYLWRIFFGRFHHSVAEDLRNRIFDKLTSLGPSYYQTHPVGQLMSLLTNDVNSFRMAIGPGLLILLDAAFYISMIVPVMISLSWSWTWKTMIVLPFVPFLIHKLEHEIHVRFRTQQDRLSDMSGRAQEIVSGIRPIKSFAQEENQAHSFNELSRAFETSCNRVAKVDSAFSPMMQLSVTFGAVILLWFCTPDVIRETITLGTFVAFHEYIKRMVWPMSAIGMGISMLQQGRASFDRIRELLSTPSDIPDLGRKEIDQFRSIEVRNLTFRYPEAPFDALKDLSFTLHSGETLGLVGPVGAGKTTLLNLICRLYPAPPNQIFINGVDLAEYSRQAIATRISMVPQDAFLFSDTVAENVALGVREFPGLEFVQQAAETVNIDHEIRSIPQSYEAQLGERGVNLSGGQKQRLTIARALIRKSDLVMFDDSLSAVDGKTEQVIVGSLREAKLSRPSQTVILVSHRLATLKHADRIIVLNSGEIEAIGQHDELLKHSATYRHLAELQSSSVEDATIWDQVLTPAGPT